MKITTDILEYLLQEDSVLISEEIMFFDYSCWHEVTHYDYLRIKEKDVHGRIEILKKVDKHGMMRYYVRR